ncbi:MAG: TetR/AcrR family transcriptional regulator [Alphaproteobacteria bacterium]
MASARRDHLVDTALELFYEHGFHATGIDKLLQKAGVAKMTLYKHFKSKDELILAALRRRDELFRNWFMRRVEVLSAEPEGRLAVLFDVLEEWFVQPGYHGCMFINAAAEFSDCSHPIHGVSAEHKLAMVRYVQEICVAAGAKDAEALANQLVLLMEGAICMSYVARQQAAARHAKEAGNILVRASLA